MSKDSPGEAGARVLGEHRAMMDRAAQLFLVTTIGEAVLAVLDAGETLTRDALLARLRRAAELGTVAEQAKAKAAIAFIEARPPAPQSPP